MGRFHVREDIAIADCAVEVWGDSLDDLFATAAGALAGLMAEAASVPERRSQAVTARADSLELLMVGWLDELLFLKDRDRTLFPRAEARVAREADGAGWAIEATLHGDVVDVEHTRRGVDVKGVTLHRLAVEPDGEGWHGRFVLDL